MTYLRQLASFIKILPVDEQVIMQALHSSFTDFEDAIQFYTAKRQQIPFLITQNTKDYTSVERKIMQVVTPEEYLQLWKASSVLPPSKRTHNVWVLLRRIGARREGADVACDVWR